MKKISTLLFIVLITFTTGKSQTNLIQGGTMEIGDEDSWSLSTLETDESNSSSYEFGFENETPSDGEGGCLHFTITNSGTNGAHLMFYQEITIKQGASYIFDMDARAIQSMNNSWFEVYLGETEPIDGADYGAGQIPLGGFKWSGWDENCTDLDLFDGSLREIGCLAGSTDTILIEGTDDVTMYIGFKAGIWATETTIEFAIDNVSLIELNGTTTAVKDTKLERVNLYPNPTSDFLHIDSPESISSVQISSMLGQEVLNTKNNLNTIDISKLNTGIYMVRLIGKNKQIETHLIRKE